jgi:hypothetical protein
MIVASAIHGKTVEQLINGDQVKRVATYSPMLIEGDRETVMALEEKPK